MSDCSSQLDADSLYFRKVIFRCGWLDLMLSKSAVGSATGRITSRWSCAVTCSPPMMTAGMNRWFCKGGGGRRKDYFKAAAAPAPAPGTTVIYLERQEVSVFSGWPRISPVSNRTSYCNIFMVNQMVMFNGRPLRLNFNHPFSLRSFQGRRTNVVDCRVNTEFELTQSKKVYCFF